MTIGDWMETPSGAKILGYSFGFGASIVIIGALFKIMHWPGASFVLTAGMGVEALLFALSAFGKPHPVYHWDHVFPQLIEDNDLEHAASVGGDFGGSHSGSSHSSAGGSVSAEAISNVPAISDEDVKKLSEGILRLSETASQLSDLTTVKAATEKYVNSMSEANHSLSKFVAVQNDINNSTSELVESYKNITTNFGSVSKSSDGFVSSVEGINKNLSSINAVYELQLNTVNLQTKSIESVSAEFDKISSSVSGVLTETELFKSESKKLAQQVSNLNSIYGSMLNAMSANA